MKTRSFVTLLLAVTLAIPALAQQSSSTSAQSTPTAQTTTKADTATGKDPLTPDTKEGFWGKLNPFARKKYVQRQTAPIQDRVNELDELTAVRFQGADKKPAGIIVQWNCHPETLGGRNTLLSADYVGYTVKHLADKYRCPVVYLTGTVGGLMTALALPLKDKAGKGLKDGTFEKAERYGVLVGELAEKAVGAAKPASLVPFDVRTR